MIPSIETIAIGDELLTGKISDTNTTWVADQLFKAGLRLSRVSVIADETSQIHATLRERSVEAEWGVVFGGLGPTSDDKTAAAVAGLLGCELIADPPSEERMRVNYERLGRPITPQALKQVLYPRAAKPLPNPRGMAPGFSCEIGKCRFYFQFRTRP